MARPYGRSMLRNRLALAAIALAAIGCTSSPEPVVGAVPGEGLLVGDGPLEAGDVEEYWAELYLSHGGYRSAYRDIARLTDCETVLENFDRNIDNVDMNRQAKPQLAEVGRGYFKAAKMRGKEIGCPAFQY
jgi:hypothetical protein